MSRQTMRQREALSRFLALTAHHHGMMAKETEELERLDKALTTDEKHQAIHGK